MFTLKLKIKINLAAEFFTFVFPPKSKVSNSSDSHGPNHFLSTLYVYTRPNSSAFYLFPIGLVFRCCWSIESWNADPWKTMSRVPEQSQAILLRRFNDTVDLLRGTRVQPESVVPLRSYNGLQDARESRDPFLLLRLCSFIATREKEANVYRYVARRYTENYTANETFIL